MQETWAWSLGTEYPLEEEMGTQFIILARKIPWTEEPGGLKSTGQKESDMTEYHHHHDQSWYSMLVL